MINRQEHLERVADIAPGAERNKTRPLHPQHRVLDLSHGSLQIDVRPVHGRRLTDSYASRQHESTQVRQILSDGHVITVRVDLVDEP